MKIIFLSLFVSSVTFLLGLLFGYFFVTIIWLLNFERKNYKVSDFHTFNISSKMRRKAKKSIVLYRGIAVLDTNNVKEKKIKKVWICTKEKF